ncbi:hypothetical protein CLTEP_21620 [Clostridium tepidiprofundi DSM 19306]|uniref:Uncharacterized protein n=1 Tax=Clostridium tepidiprofundi DSM 19306 TaxID=1121338 RepID=A0A151B028_9CLOT|nr:hypothetical protein CLTEP_21620 [Clostridium tepidiprofundi DSM 19306]
MNCINCKQDMLYGKIYFDASVIERFWGTTGHLFFSEFCSNSKPIKLIPYKEHCIGYYCINCGDAWLNVEHIHEKCLTCNNDILYGKFYAKSAFTRFNYDHLDFINLNNITYKIFDASSYIRGYYCKNCGISYFNIKNIVT